MIEISNTYIPTLKRKKGSSTKEDTIIATTDSGDVAYYSSIVKKKPKKKKEIPSFLLPEYLKGFGIDDGDDDGDSSDEDGDIIGDTGLVYKPQRSLSGADWKPKFNDRMTMFIAGTPGAGKSYLAKEMIGLLPSTYKILLFTALEENDGNFDSLGKERLFKIKMTPDVLSKISLSEIRERSDCPQTILLFDDINKIRDPKIQNLTFAIMNDALANGRGHEKHDGNGDLHVLCTSHSANDYQKTKYSFENSNYVALFPGTTPPLQLHRMFDKMGLDKNLCKEMIRLARMQKIRSVIIHKVVPMYMIFGDKIMLL